MTGLNVNRGQKILLRLRHAGDQNQFLPVEQVTDTMLHELSHIVHGDHDAAFHALWDQLRDEHEGLLMKGYTGEGFLTEGRRLGGSSEPPMHEARRLARAAAERRRAQTAGSGRKLGGTAPRPGQDIRKVIADAAERRNKTLKGCGNTTHDDNEIQIISETATKNGFKTQAEEDAANEAAIAQALWELVQEDEKLKRGSSYVHPSANNPMGNGGGMFLPEAYSSESSGASRSSEERGAVPPPPPPPPKTERPLPREIRATKPRMRSPSPEPARGWTCGICTLHNPANFLCCDACGTERPEDMTRRLAAEGSSKRARTRETVDLTRDVARAALGASGSSSSSVSAAAVARAAAAANPAATWHCSFCGTEMERQWWTCSTCGTMKDSSR